MKIGFVKIFLSLMLVIIVSVQASPALATNHLVQIDEIMTGINGDSSIQFVEMRMCCFGQNVWGDVALLAFFDSDGTQIGEFIFPSNPPDSGGSVLIATQAFADLPAPTPDPDFIMDPLLDFDAGKVCYRNNPVNTNFNVNLCLSYGNFLGDTENDVCANPAGLPADPLAISGIISLQRVNNFANFECGQFNADFALGFPAPANAAGITGPVNTSNGDPFQLAFLVQPSDTALGDTISPAVQVEAQDQQGNPVSSAASEITLSIGNNPGGGILSGSLTISGPGAATVELRMWPVQR